MSAFKRVVLSFVALFLVTFTVTSIVKTQTGINHNHVVSLATAEKYVTNFRNNPSVPQIKGGMFDRNVFDAILGQTGCVGIRYYYAKKDDGSATLVVVGVNSAGNDMENGIIAEEINPCPPICASPGVLNK
ncbi:MAG: hypothetical protein WCW35_12465 [Bacteroidota bacterium]|jgi:hypothetical protein